jgi:glycosyltransferase involved in cell wall biosynthesis
VISIAMATYNGETFLEQQLGSVSKQTLLPAELVVCDTSSDATAIL